MIIDDESVRKEMDELEPMVLLELLLKDESNLSTKLFKFELLLLHETVIELLLLELLL